MEVDERKQRIIDSHPLLYAENHWFAVGDGWLDLIEELSDNLEAQIVDYKKRFPEDEVPMCSETKEKHGTLRFYMTSGTTSMWEAIDKAQDMSKKMCDVCGKHGALRSGRWLKTRCEQHVNT